MPDITTFVFCFFSVGVNWCHDDDCKRNMIMLVVCKACVASELFN